jgi:hypothetical protein
VTAVGETQPREWTELRDSATGHTYWWCQPTGETTELQAPHPTVGWQPPVGGVGGFLIFGAGSPAGS